MVIIDCVKKIPYHQRVVVFRRVFVAKVTLRCVAIDRSKIAIICPHGGGGGGGGGRALAIKYLCACRAELPAR